jgi:hypothetical protein
VEVSHRVREDFNDGENYLKMRGAEIVVPEREGWRPDRAALAWHNERRFRG